MRYEVVKFTNTKPFVYPDHIAIMVVLEGELTAKRFNDIREFKQEDLFFVNINEVIHLKSQKGAVVFSVLLSRDDLKCINIENIDQMQLVNDTESLDKLKTFDEIYRDCAFIKNLLLLTEKQDEESVQEIIISICYSLINDYNTHKKTDDLAVKFYKLKAELALNYKQKLSLENISKKNMMNKTYFAQCWKKVFDLSYYESATKLRLKEIEKELIFTDKTSEKIWKEYSFTSKKQYFAAFNQWFGTTPLKWSKKFCDETDTAVLSPVDSSSYINQMLERYSHIHTETNFAQLIKVCGWQACADKINVKWYHSSNSYKIENETVFSNYGLDILVYLAHRKGIGLNFIVDVKKLKSVKSFLTQINILNRNDICKFKKDWNFIITVSDLSQMKKAKSLYSALEDMEYQKEIVVNI